MVTPHTHIKLNNKTPKKKRKKRNTYTVHVEKVGIRPHGDQPALAFKKNTKECGVVDKTSEVAWGVGFFLFSINKRNQWVGGGEELARKETHQ